MPANPARGWVEVLKDPLRTIHTVRHLQAVQVTNRAARWLRPQQTFAGADRDVQLVTRAASRPAPSSDGTFDGRSFCFLNRRIVWEGDSRWFPESADALWVYNLHYFRYLWSAAPADASRLIADWIDANRDRGTVAWDAYPTSLRAREWIEWLQANQDVTPTLRQSMVASLAEQVELLRRRLEFHLMGNHLLENAITLCWAGLSFSGSASDAWRKEGGALLRQELSRQVLADGTHEERTPMYQALLAEALLRLSEVAERSCHAEAPRLRDEALCAGQRLLRSLEHMVHPDGEYAVLNDTALGVAPSHAALAKRFNRVTSCGEGMWLLPEAGYAGYRSPSTYFVFDGGPIGPNHQPGHGHADALSFELSHRGRRLLTDTGVFTYTWGRERQHDRSTAAHNTIEIDGRSQSEVWGAFRCARRTSGHWLRAAAEPRRTIFSAGYRGPGRDRHQVCHVRTVEAARRGLSFVDELTAPGSRTATLRLHIAPDVQVRHIDRGWRLEDASSGRALAFVIGGGLDWTLTTSPYHPEFGREIERPSLEARLSFRDHAIVNWRLMLL